MLTIVFDDASRIDLPGVPLADVWARVAEWGDATIVEIRWTEQAR